MWATAQTCWFITNASLDMTVTFPVLSAAPAGIAALWGIFLFKEIRGRRNYVLVAIAYALTIVGVVMIAVSSKLEPPKRTTSAPTTTFSPIP